MDINKKSIRTLLLGAIGCIILYWLLNETERVKAFWNAILKVAQPFLVGSALAFILNVPMRAVERSLSGIKNDAGRRALAIFLTILSMLLVVMLFRVVLLTFPELCFWGRTDTQKYLHRSRQVVRLGIARGESAWIL